MVNNMQKLQQKQHLEVNGVVVKVTDDGLYCLNDLHKAAGGDQKLKPAHWHSLDSTKRMITEMEKVENPTFSPVQVVRGRNGGTYACKEMVYSYVMWLDQGFAIRVIRTFDAVASGDEQTALKIADTQASRARAEELLTMMDDYANLTYLGAHTKTAVAAVLASEELTPEQRLDGEMHRKALQRRGIHLASVVKQVVRDQGGKTDMGKLVDAVQRHQEVCFDFSPEYLRDFTTNMIGYGALTESMGIIKVH